MNTPRQCETCRHSRSNGEQNVCRVRTVHLCEHRGDVQRLREKPAPCAVLNPDNDCEKYQPRRAWPVFLFGASAVVAVALVLAGLLWVGLYYAEGGARRPDGATPSGKPAIRYTTEIAAAPTEPEPAVTPEEIQRVYRSHVLPMIEATNAANQAAAAEALRAFDREFQRFHDGVDPFVRDLTRFRTRFGVLRRLAADKFSRIWNGDEASTQLEAYIGGKFAEHVMTGDALEALIEDTLTQYMDAVEANRNALLVQIDRALRTDAIPLGAIINARIDEAFLADAMQHLVEAARQRGVDSVTYGIISYVLGEIACHGPIHTIRAISAGSARIAAAAAGALASRTVGALSARLIAGGAGNIAAVNTAAAGSAAGSVIGPAGTIGGLVGGIVIGVAVDLWLTTRFEADARLQLTETLHQLNTAIVHGQQDAPENKGLQAILQEANDTVFNATTEAVQAAMLGGK